MNEILLTTLVFHALAAVALTVGAAVAGMRELHRRRIVPLHSPDWREHRAVADQPVLRKAA